MLRLDVWFVDDFLFLLSSFAAVDDNVTATMHEYGVPLPARTRPGAVLCRVRTRQVGYTRGLCVCEC